MCTGKVNKENLVFFSCRISSTYLCAIVVAVWRKLEVVAPAETQRGREGHAHCLVVHSEVLKVLQVSRVYRQDS